MKAKDLQTSEKQGAGCLFLCSDTNRFLLIQRSETVSLPLTWCLPGGSVDAGETPVAAAVREAKEEIGFVIDPSRLKLIYTNETHAPRFRYFTYACIVPTEFTVILNWESSGFTWCDLDSLPSPLHWGVQQLLNHDRAARKLKSMLDDYKHRSTSNIA